MAKKYLPGNMIHVLCLSIVCTTSVSCCIKEEKLENSKI